MEWISEDGLLYMIILKRLILYTVMFSQMKKGLTFLLNWTNNQEDLTLAIHGASFQTRREVLWAHYLRTNQELSSLRGWNGSNRLHSQEENKRWQSRWLENSRSVIAPVGKKYWISKKMTCIVQMLSEIEFHLLKTFLFPDTL